MNHILPWLVVFILVAFSAFIRREEVFAPTDQSEFGKRYAESQYVMGEAAISKIDDSAIYTYAAMAYMRGEDPATINFEHPPLGKYFFGLSYVAFQRVLVANLFFMYGVLIISFYLIKLFKFPNWFVYGSVVYMALYSSIANHLRTALLDLQVLFFSLLFFLLLFSLKETWRKYILLGVCLGLLTAIKYFFPVLFLYYALLAGWALYHRNIIKLIAAGFLILLTYLSTYTAYFLHHHSLLDLARFEIYRYNWWTNGRQTMSFSIFETLFKGSFPIWWLQDGVTRIRDTDWNISWPVLFVLSTVSAVFNRLEKKNVVLVLFNFGLIAIYIAGSAVFGRYLIQLMPLWIILLGNAVFNRRTPFWKYA